MSSSAMRAIRCSSLSQSNCEQSLFQELPVHVLQQRDSTNQTQIQSKKKKKILKKLFPACTLVLFLCAGGTESLIQKQRSSSALAPGSTVESLERNKLLEKKNSIS
jgi:hypothetical protein